MESAKSQGAQKVVSKNLPHSTSNAPKWSSPMGVNPRIRRSKTRESTEEAEGIRTEEVTTSPSLTSNKNKVMSLQKLEDEISIRDKQIEQLTQDNRELAKQLNDTIDLLAIEKAKNDIELITRQRVVGIEAEMNAILAQYRQLTDASVENTKEKDRQRDKLLQEQNRANKLIAELELRDKELSSRAAEFEGQVKEWQERISFTQTDHNEQAPIEMLSSVEEAGDEVSRYEREWKRCQLLTDEAFHKFVDSQKSMKDKVETLENWLTLMENRVSLPEAKCFNDLLRAIQHINTTNKKRCFISYAWNVDKKENTKLQARLIKNDLVRAGIEVMLDIQNMEGDINLYMSGGIQQCDRVLLICTPRLKQRIEELSSSLNNLQKEYHAALARQATNPKFIIPLILEGTRDTSISSSFAHILSLDFADQVEYRDRMVSLQPKGLIPMILGLDDNLAYDLMLTAYKFQLSSLSVQTENKS